MILGEKLKPTADTEISSQIISLLGLEIFHWDFGGQEQYRQQYIEKSSKYFTSIKLMIFVIDIQDEKRYNEALKYLEIISHIIKEANQDCKIFVLFHKYDPGSAMNEILDINIEELKKKIKKVNPFEDIHFYKTSIFSKISLLRAFSNMATYFSDKTQLIQDFLKTYCEKTYSEVAILFDKRNFVLDSREKKEEVVKMLEIISHIFLNGIEELEKYSLETFEIVSLVQPSDYKEDESKAMIFIQKLDLDFKLYLISLSTDPITKHLVYDNMKILTENLIELFNK